MAERRRRLRKLAIVVVGLGASMCLTLPGGMASAEPSDEAKPAEPTSKPVPEEPITAPPGPYGSDTYYSSSEELALLSRIGQIAQNSDAVGSKRTDETTMLVRVPQGTKAPADLRVGTFTVHFETSRFTPTTLDALRDEIREQYLAIDRARAATMGSIYDPVDDVLVVSGRVPDTVADAWAHTPGVAFTASDFRRTSRWNDISPFYSGGALFNAALGRCTSGFPLVGSSGTQFLITAAHCYPLNTHVYSPGSKTSPTNYRLMGTVTRRPSNYPARDIELISGQEYDPYIWMGGEAGTPYRVSSARDASVGDVLCTSGTTTNQACGKVVTTVTGAELCEGGCTRWLTATEGGGWTQAGDSGGPLINLGPSSVGVRGMIVGRGEFDDRVANVYHRWTTIVDEWPGIRVMLG